MMVLLWLLGSCGEHIFQHSKRKKEMVKRKKEKGMISPSLSLCTFSAIERPMEPSLTWWTKVIREPCEEVLHY